MKTFKYLLIAFTFLFFACDKDESGPKITCKISKQTQTGSGGSGDDYYSYVNTKTFDRDNNNNITKIAAVSTYTYGDNTTSTGNDIQTFEYDKDGFLLKDIIDNSSVGKDKSNNYYKATTIYEYSNRTLVKRSFSSTSSIGSSSATYTYEYNNEGRLIKSMYNSIAPFPTSAVYEYGYSNGKLSTYAVTANGKTTVQSIETDSKGRILSITNAPYITKYAYDNDGNRILVEYLNNGKKTNAVKNTYDGKKNIDLLMSPTLKGHPENILYPTASANLVSSESYTYDNAGVEKMESSTTIAYTYNGSGYPLTSSSSTSTSTYNINYEFIDCP